LASQHLRGINVDIIMVDDGSSDTSLSLLRSIASNISYSNYSVIHLSPNGGAAAARNAGVAAATGKVIAFAESDDWYLRDSTSQGDYLWENCPKVRCRIQPLVCIDALLFRRKSSSFELLNNGS
jgi:glycosyltransferase involved in cell wall biosynthesis